MSPPFPTPADLLPHRSPMLLLRAVVSHEAGATTCEGGFDDTFAGFCGGEVSAAFGLELIAQAAAVHHGLRQRSTGESPGPASRGLLLGSRRLQLEARNLPVGEPLQVTILDGGQGPGSGGMIRFEGRVENAAGQILVAGDATVLEWRSEDEPAA